MSRLATIASRREFRISAALTLLALLLRLIHLASIRGSTLFNHPFIDLRMYDLWAQRIAAGEWVRETPFFLDPLYPYFLGVIYAALGRSFLTVAVIQSLLFSVCAAVLYLVARRWFDETTAIVAAVLLAVYLPGIYWSPLLMKPALSVFLVTVMLALLSRALGAGEGWAWLAAGAALALAALTRTTLVWVVPVLLLWIVLARRLGPKDAARLTRRRWARAATFAGGVAMVFSLTLAHNLSTGEPIVTTANHGAIFFLGNNPDNPEGEFLQMYFLDPRPEFEQSDFKREAERRAGRPLSHREASRFWLGEGIAWAREHPADWLGVSWRKLRVLWGIYETPASLDYYLYREYAPVLRLPLPGFGVLGPLALLGLFLAAGRSGWPRLLVVFVAAACLSAIAFFVLTRFRMVLLPALTVLAAHGAVELARRIRAAMRSRDAKPLLGPLAGLLAAVVFVAVPVRLPQDSMLLRGARALGIPTRVETTALAHLNLGRTYASLASESAEPAEPFRLAEAELREALRLEPSAATWIELGNVLARQQRNADAIEAYRQAAVLEPGYYRVHHGLGLLLRREGRWSDAAAEFDRALAAQPRYAPSAVQLGECLSELGQADRAAEAFRHALRLDPDSAAARRGLESLGRRQAR